MNIKLVGDVYQERQILKLWVPFQLMELSNGFSSLNEVLESISYLCTQYKKRQTEQVAFCVLQHFRQGETKGIQLKEMSINKTIATFYLVFLREIKFLKFEKHLLNVI
jgi:hypothetical protein